MYLNHERQTFNFFKYMLKNYKISFLFCSFLLILLSPTIMSCGLFSSRNDITVPNNLNPKGVVKTACTQLGKNYSLGGCSPQKGFDCSGLVWWAYKQHGVKLPRITTEQLKAGKAVSKKQIRAGDIVIFRTNQSPRGLHTGLYAGEGYFIHSPGRGKKVQIERLAKSWWRDRLIAARRIAQ